MDPQKSAFLVFKENPQKIFSLCLGFDSPFKTIDTQMFFWSVFLKMHKKSYWPSKMPFWLFLAFSNVFLCVLLNTDQNNICVATVFQASTKQKYEEFFLRFLIKNSKMPFLGVNQFFFLIFFQCYLLKQKTHKCYFD